MPSDKNTTQQPQLKIHNESDQRFLQTAQPSEDSIQDALVDPLIEEPSEMGSSDWSLTAELNPSSDGSHFKNLKPDHVRQQSNNQLLTEEQVSAPIFEGIRSQFDQSISAIADKKDKTQNALTATNTSKGSLFGGLVQALSETKDNAEDLRWLEHSTKSSQNLQYAISEQLKTIEQLQYLEPHAQIKQLQTLYSMLNQSATELRELQSPLKDAVSAEQSTEIRALNADLSRTLHAVLHAMPHIKTALQKLQHLNPMLQEPTALNVEKHELNEETDFLSHLLQGALILADIHGSSVSRMSPQSAAHQSENILRTPVLSFNPDQEERIDEKNLLETDEQDLLDDPQNKY